MKKWKIEAIIVVVLLVLGLGIWWYISTGDERQASAQFEQLVKYANRQEVEIAIIKQDAELKMLKRAMAAANQRQQTEIAAAKQKIQDKIIPKQE